MLQKYKYKKMIFIEKLCHSIKVTVLSLHMQSCRNVFFLSRPSRPMLDDQQKNSNIIMHIFPPLASQKSQKIRYFFGRRQRAKKDLYIFWQGHHKFFSLVKLVQYVLKKPDLAQSLAIRFLKPVFFYSIVEFCTCPLQ